MHQRNDLGPADVSDEQLTAMVADLLGAEPAHTEVLESTVTEFPYDLPAITTAGRYWVSGTASIDGTERPWRMFVKVVQSWARHPFFAEVPPEFREMAAAMVPWRTEPLAYRSELGDLLPDGLLMPRALGVFDLDELSCSIWLEEIEVEQLTWDLATYREAAVLLGRLAASPRVAELADVGETGFTIRNYRDGRLNVEVLPTLRDDGIWKHPLVAGSFDETLHARILTAADRTHDLVEELMALPFGSSHGDACPNNLLRSPGVDGFVLIDYGYWAPEPFGYDLAQLLVGEVQLGRGSVEDLQAVEDAIVPAYVDGLRAEGCDVPEDVVRRAHAIQMLVFTGLSCLPVEHLDAEPTAELHRIAARRAAIARFILDLLDATETVPSSKRS